MDLIVHHSQFFLVTEAQTVRNWERKKVSNKGSRKVPIEDLVLLWRRRKRKRNKNRRWRRSMGRTIKAFRGQNRRPAHLQRAVSTCRRGTNMQLQQIRRRATARQERSFCFFDFYQHTHTHHLTRATEDFLRRDKHN